MPRKKATHELSRRERQILELLFKLGEASVAEVLEQLSDPPGYDSVRTTIRLLESKGYLRHRREGAKYVYRPTQSRKSASHTALTHLMNTFFRGSPSDTMAAVFDVVADDLTDEELRRLEKLIEQARKEGR